MIKNIFLTVTLVTLVVIMSSCAKNESETTKGDDAAPAVKTVFTGAKGEVKIITLDPGHFHAALIQKVMFEQMSPTVHVYGPDGSDVQDHLNQIKGFNSRTENPTTWKEVIYTGDDYLEKMIAEKKGNVVVISGCNKKKTLYIKACVDAGLNVLADKPMCITPDDFVLLKEAFVVAKKNGVFIYDIMTERSSITTILQKELSINKDVFGDIKTGTVEKPAVISESVHHFFKFVAGNPIKRPDWYFDTTQQGEGIVDVTVHLTDLIMWATFPDTIIDYTKDIKILKAQRWATPITFEKYKKVTHLHDLTAFPDYLEGSVDDKGVLQCYANGAITYSLKGIVSKAKVEWRYEAPEGTKDTHYALMSGSICNLEIRQGAEQNFKPELYVVPAEGINGKALDAALLKAVAGFQETYPNVSIEMLKDEWHITAPDALRIGHEAHFGEVAERFLQFLVDDKLPQWEVPNMTAKYFTTTTALKMAQKE